MYKKIPGGSVEIIENSGFKYECQIPPVGYGKNISTGEIEFIGIIKRSTKASEQYWERIELPNFWNKRRAQEIEKQKLDTEFFDPELETIRNTHWRYRLCGLWFYNEGVEVYIPPSYFFYLNWCPLDIGYANYRNSDKKFFYVWEYCIEDPRCAGLANLQRRRTGKTYISGSILLDRASRMKHHHAGIQSKTNTDSKQIFQKTIIGFFKKLPDFFKPVFDLSKGVTPTSELRFFQTTVKGKRANEIIGGTELESWIDYGSSDIFYYDGYKLNSYVMDEFGKTSEVNVWDRWNVVRWCMDQDGKWIGAALLTSTIEDLDSGGLEAKKIWDASDANQRDKNGRTQSGLYRFFLPAYETTMFDRYGNPEIEKAKVHYLNQRDGLKNDSRALSSIIRKAPFTIEEAFRIDGDRCLFDAMKLNERLDLLSWNTNYTTRGNFVWDNAERDTKVKFVPSKSGRWEVAKLLEEDEANRVDKRGDSKYPLNSNAIVGGVDPYDHNSTNDERRSDGAAYFKFKYSALKENDPYNDAFIIKYRYRPPTAAQFYEDVILTAHYCGCEILCENNKLGLIRYFQDRGYGKFLMRVPGNKEAGVAASPKTHQEIAECHEAYINDNTEKIYFASYCKEALEFDLSNTTKYDEIMSAGYCLIADKYKKGRATTGKVADITDYFKMSKVV